MTILALSMLAMVVPLSAQGQNENASAQAKPGQPTSQKTAQPQHQVQQPLRIQTVVVRLPVTVRGPHGHLVLDLGPEDFQVYDKKHLEHILSFVPGGNPVSAVLVVEDSSRISGLLPAVRKTGIIFTQVVMGGNGRGAVIGFSDKPHVIVPFTADHDKVQKAVNDLKSGGDGAHLYDALGQAVRMLQNQPPGRRRVIVAVAESVDTGSLMKLGNVLREAQLANISIYAIGLSTTEAELRAPAQQYSGPSFGPPGTFSHPGYPGVPQTPTTMSEQSGNINLLALVERLVKLGVNLVSPEALAAASAATGGEHIKTFHDRSIVSAMNRIGTELHAEYTIAYQAPKGPPGYHQIDVKVTRPGYTVRTRPGYFLAPPNGSTSSGSP